MNPTQADLDKRSRKEFFFRQQLRKMRPALAAEGIMLSEDLTHMIVARYSPGDQEDDGYCD